MSAGIIRCSNIKGERETGGGNETGEIMQNAFLRLDVRQQLLERGNPVERKSNLSKKKLLSLLPLFTVSQQRVDRLGNQREREGSLDCPANPWPPNLCPDIKLTTREDCCSRLS